MVFFFLLQEQKVFFKCKEGHSGQFVYIRDDRPDKEYFGLCEVEVFHYKGKKIQFKANSIGPLMLIGLWSL